MSNVDVLMTPTEFFRDAVMAALQRQNLAVDQEQEFYLVNLLCDFINLQNLPGEGEDSAIFLQPLALTLKEALEAPPSRQIKIYKVLGDTSLYVAGYFQDYFNRKCYDVDYFITIGRGAYGNLSDLAREQHRDRHFAELYRKLAGNFGDFVEVLAEISDRFAPNRPVDLLATYERWHRSGSERLRRKLEDSGISPVPGDPKSEQ